jgi:hypothetical protein
MRLLHLLFLALLFAGPCLPAMAAGSSGFNSHRADVSPREEHRRIIKDAIQDLKSVKAHLSGAGPDSKPGRARAISKIDSAIADLWSDLAHEDE